jgi:hypothetical protein
VVKAVKEIPDCNPQRQDRKPVLFEKWQPLIPVGEPFVFHKLAKKDIAPDGTQSEGDWIENQPEDDVFCRYCGPVFLLWMDMYTIS